MSSDILLEVKDLSISFHTDDGTVAEITDKVSFSIRQGEIFGLVGESGCGKTVTALSLLRLLPQPITKIHSGSITLNGKNILALSYDEMRAIRGREISVIFQEPTAALNPLLTIKKQLEELFEYHSFTADKNKRILELLKRVGFPDPDRILKAYPHELSGGMLQRAMIALALILKPSLIIADEPTTALDVTVQAQVLELLIEMQKEFGTSVLFITHNLNLIAQYADRLAVMYAGRIVEESDLEPFLEKPLHPYSQGLMAALPDLNTDNPVLQAIPGSVPQPKEYMSGCRFKDRCNKVFDRCVEKPSLLKHGPSQRVACFLFEDEKEKP